ncbi:MAG: dTDP-4-dehydrorhamnose reductase [Gemmatimonadales bacterium]
MVVTGSGGLLGTRVAALAASRGHDVVALRHADLDVTDEQRVAAAITRHEPGAVIHCAAYTAVDRAESEADRAFAVNRDGARHVAAAAKHVGAIVVYVSTDYVFDGSSAEPYAPGDRTGPLSVYGRSKLEGESAVEQVGGEWLIVRTSWLYGGASGFVPAILRRASRGEPLRVVDDQRGRPTWAPHAAEAMLELLERGARSVWHVAAGGDCTWYQLATEALRLSNHEVPVERISSAAFGAPARRPAYSVLDLEATERLLGRRMPHWREGLAQYVGGDWAELQRRTA